MSRATEAVEALAERLRALDWSRDLWVAGSLATGDHVPGVSDLDLVAVVDGEITSERRHEVEGLHRALDAGPAAGTDLGCQYVEAARAELLGYWAWAARRPQMWWSPVIADLGLTAMARGRHALATGQLLTKSEAIEQAAAPRWLVGQLLARRRGEAVTSPRARTAWIAWRDARRTVGAARRRWSDEALEDVE